MNSLFFKRLAIGGVVGWIIVFALVPNLILGGASFLHRNEVSLIHPTLTLQNYGRLLEPAFFNMLLDSIVLASLAMLLCLLIGYPFAYIVARAPEKTSNIMLLLVMVPFWTNSLIRVYALIAILKADGILNSLLLKMGVIGQPLSLMYTPVAVFVGLVYTLLPFMILPLYAAIKRLDINLLEAARDLGAGRIRTFWKITIPLTMPGIIAGCMLVFIPALGMFYIPDILGGARTMLIGNYIRDQFLTARDLPMGSAASVMLTLIMGIMLLFYYYSVHRSGTEAEI
jgi:spermidine/putrescine transport system permease protein